MNNKVVITKYGEITYLCADEGKILILDDFTKIDKLAITPNFDISRLVEVDDPDYVPPEPVSPSEVDALKLLKENQIKLSKLNLSAYLETHPLFSTVKYEDGRYYNVTSEKQQQMTSKMMLNEMYKGQGIPYELTWNDTGNVCEPWTEVELATLSMQVDAYVTPLIKMQQTIEVQIKNATTQEEVLQIDVTYSDENIQRYVTES